MNLDAKLQQSFIPSKKMVIFIGILRTLETKTIKSKNGSFDVSQYIQAVKNIQAKFN